NCDLQVGEQLLRTLRSLGDSPGRLPLVKTSSGGRLYTYSINVDHLGAQPSCDAEQGDTDNRQCEGQDVVPGRDVAQPCVDDKDCYNDKVDRHVPDSKPLGFTGQAKQIDQAGYRCKKSADDAADHCVECNVVPDRRAPAGSIDDVTRQREDP